MIGSKYKTKTPTVVGVHANLTINQNWERTILPYYKSQGGASNWLSIDTLVTPPGIGPTMNIPDPSGS